MKGKVDDKEIVMEKYQAGPIGWKKVSQLYF